MFCVKKNGLLPTANDRNKKNLFQLFGSKGRNPKLCLQDPAVFWVLVWAAVLIHWRRRGHPEGLQRRQGRLLPLRLVLALPCPQPTLHSQLGEGGFATVWRGRLCGHDVAAKVLKEPTEQNLHMLQQEGRLLHDCRHAHVLHIWPSDPGSLCTELMAGPLSYAQVLNGLMPAPVLARLCKEVLEAIAHLHSLRVAHGDVKPDNILVSSFDFPFCARLGDFGLVEHLEPGGTLTAWQGNPGFIAPEMYLLRGQGTPVDVWALGVTGYCLLYDAMPWNMKEELKPQIEGQPIVPEP